MSRTLLVINGAAVTGCAFLDHPLRTTLLTGLLLLLPLLDRKHLHLQSIIERSISANQVVALILILILLMVNPDYLLQATGIIFLIALPEEWFFRYWLMTRIEKESSSAVLSNIVTSLLFSIVHIPSQGARGLLVFFPSLLLGYLFQKQKDLFFVILVHAIFNITYELYIHPLMSQ